MNSFQQENTARIISRAARLGYTITKITTTKNGVNFEINPSSPNNYTPKIKKESGEWKIQTADHGSVNIDQIQEITEGYQRAAAIISELETLTANHLLEYAA